MEAISLLFVSIAGLVDTLIIINLLGRVRELESKNKIIEFHVDLRDKEDKE
jgi:hypothetical protein